jgi:hypothetical protein
MLHLKKILVYSLLILLCACKKEPVFNYPPKPVVIIKAGDARLSSKTIHFVKDTVYELAVTITIASGQKFIIDAGTLIKITQNPSRPGLSIIVQPDGIIEARGTKEEPVVFTSNADKGKAQNADWTGIQIFGNANGNSSGILNYIRVEFAGRYNTALNRNSGSLLLSGVSKLTDINNIQVSYSGGVSFEFYNGNCNAYNLLSYSATGIDFNLINGYKGKLQNILAYRHPSFAEGGTNNLAGVNILGPITEPSISNLTVLGPAAQYGIVSNYLSGAPNRRAGIITGDGCKFHIRNSAVINYPLKAYYLYSAAAAGSLDSGRSDFTYSVINPTDTTNPFYLPNNVYFYFSQAYNSKDLKDFLLRPKFNNEIVDNINKLMLANPYGYFDGIPDPMPKTGSPLLAGANFTDSTGIFTDPFFKSVAYRGALGADNWMQGWVNFIPLQTDYNN